MTEETVKELIDGGQEDVKIPVLVIDIETGKSPDMAKYIKPFDEETDVKYGNAKNEELRENIKSIMNMKIMKTMNQIILGLEIILMRMILILF